MLMTMKYRFLPGLLIILIILCPLPSLSIKCEERNGSCVHCLAHNCGHCELEAGEMCYTRGKATDDKDDCPHDCKTCLEVS